MPTPAELIAALATGDQPTSFATHRQLAELVRGAGGPGHESERTELARLLASELNAPLKRTGDDGKESESPRSLEARRQIAALLAEIGGQDEVPALVTALGDFSLREDIRWALSRIPAPAATEALVNVAKNGIGPEFRLGAINALASRQGTEVTAALKHAALDEDVEVRNAAAEALAAFPDPGHDQVLAAVLKFGQPSPRTRTRLVRARLRLAETLAGAGKKDDARRIYQALVDEGSPETDGPQIAAARRALAELA